MILQEPIKNARVIVPDKNGELTPGATVDLPAGILMEVPKR